MEKKHILVTGGAGYIGSVCVKRLLDKGYLVSVIDNLSKGVSRLVDSRAKFFKGDLMDKSFLVEVFSKSSFDCVIHFAAYKAVGESMNDAVKYSDNIVGTINLLNEMVKNNVKKIIFSSSAAVYGESNGVMDEEKETLPINFYGFTKLEVERILRWYKEIHGVSYVSFRYFNVAGDELMYIDPDAENLFPIIGEVLEGKRSEFVVFGNDYDTKDGTCIRDYVDVRDIVEAHILGIEADYNGIINLGNSKGFSVLEIVDAFKRISRVDFKMRVGDKRAGDVSVLIASNTKAKEILGWESKYSIDDMVSSTLKAYRS